MHRFTQLLSSLSLVLVLSVAESGSASTVGHADRSMRVFTGTGVRTARWGARRWNGNITIDPDKKTVTLTEDGPGSNGTIVGELTHMDALGQYAPPRRGAASLLAHTDDIIIDATFPSGPKTAPLVAQGDGRAFVNRVTIAIPRKGGRITVEHSEGAPHTPGTYADTNHLGKTVHVYTGPTNHEALLRMAQEEDRRDLPPTVSENVLVPAPEGFTEAQQRMHAFLPGFSQAKYTPEGMHSETYLFPGSMKDRVVKAAESVAGVSLDQMAGFTEEGHAIVNGHYKDRWLTERDRFVVELDLKGHPTGVVYKQQPSSAEQQAIAERAYALFLARGGAHGDDRADWLQAEREVRDEMRYGRPRPGPRSGDSAQKGQKAQKGSDGSHALAASLLMATGLEVMGLEALEVAHEQEGPVVGGDQAQQGVDLAGQ